MFSNTEDVICAVIDNITHCASKNSMGNSETLLYLFISIDEAVSLVKLHIIQIKRSLTHDQKKHHGREHS